MDWVGIFIALTVGYFMGAIPVGYLAARLRGVDVRKVGSGRTGTTNVFRATGPIPAFLTVLGDALKGVVAIYLVRGFTGNEWLAALAGIAAVAGHNWSVFLGWKGGAGAVTAISILYILSPKVALGLAIPVFLVIILLRYASVASLTIAVGGSIGVLILLIMGREHPAHLFYAVGAGALIVYALRPNIKRLLEGTERRIGEKVESTPPKA